MRRTFVALAIAALALLGLAGTASAHQLFPYAYSSSFNGSDSSAGAFTSNVSKVAINEATGRVYVLDNHQPPVCCGATNAFLSQFNAAGVAQPFTAPGTSSIDLGEVCVGCGVNDMIVDNSGHNSGIWSYGNPPDPEKSIYNLNFDGSERIVGGAGRTYNECGLAYDAEGWIYQDGGQWSQRMDPATGFWTNDEAFFAEQEPCHVAFDNEDYGYIVKSTNTDQGGPGLYKYYKGKENLGLGNGDENDTQFSHVQTQYLTIDQTNNDMYTVENGNRVSVYAHDGAPQITFGGPEGSYEGLEGAEGIAVNQTNKDVYVTSTKGGGHVDIFHRTAPVTVPDEATEPAGHPSKTSAVLRGTVNPDGVETTECKIEWGAFTKETKGFYASGSVPCDQGNNFSGSSDQQVSHEVKSLTNGQTYHYRVAAKNANGYWSYSGERRFQASIAPVAEPVIVDRVNTDGARFTAEVVPNGGTTEWAFEYGLEDCETHECTQVPLSDETLGSNTAKEQVQVTANGLQADTPYFGRLVAVNGAGEDSYSFVFRTFPSPPHGDACGNAHVRQQVLASLLPDCRAYELVSARNAGGYEVESDLVPGQTPYGGYPSAPNRVLYGLHFGSLPGAAGEPPNYGVDPYVAERGQTGWTSRYVGVPAGGMADEDPFGSPVLAADESLSSFAFGGPGICNPCFAGAGTNIPLRLHGGAPVKGMAGSVPTGEVKPEGSVAKYMSADGSHLVFGSTAQFEPLGAGGALTIYERNLQANSTEVVSTDQAGATLSGPGVSELDLSSDGSRTIIGDEVSTDSAGNVHNHLYMHIAGKAASIDLTPGGSAVYSGMTPDGSLVFFTTTDKLSGSDTDTSADIYSVAVDAAGNAGAPQLVTTDSTGAASNSDLCSPQGNPNSWNSVSGAGKCNAVAFAGGAGVGADGTFYFVSPEQLEGGEGEADEANLYVVKPGGHPQYVATIDSAVGKSPPAPEHPVVDSDVTGTSLTGAEGMAIDESNGDIYLIESEKFSRYDSSGAPHNFSAGPGAGTNTISGGIRGSSEAGIAVDNSSSPMAGDVYVTKSDNSLKIYDQTGAQVGSLTGSETSTGSFGYACGVAVDPTDGSVIVGDYNGHIWRYTPKPAATAPFEDSDYTASGISTPGLQPCEVGVDGAGNVYGIQWPTSTVKKYELSSFAPAAPGQAGSVLNSKGSYLAADTSRNEVYLNEVNQISIYNTQGEKLTTFGVGSVSGSRGIAVNGVNHHAFAPSNGKLVEFGFVEPPFNPVSNPAIVHGVRQAATHSYADFQVTPNGRYSAFASNQSLTGFPNLGRMEIYRYDSETDALECASCPITGAAPKTDTTLASLGLGLTDDGRLFFTSKEGLVLSDTNEKRDVYEWAGGVNIGKISSGTSNAEASLLGASHNGVDAFFFTRQVLVPEDENGSAMKIYDAREGGGFATETVPPPCAASDECHGPGTREAPPPDIRSITGSGEQAAVPKTGGKSCKKGFVKRNGRCVRKQRHKHSKRRHHKGRNHG